MISGFLWITTQEELNQCFSVRKKVFMDEQGFEDEFDDIDDIAHHLLFLDDQTPIATLRMYIDKDVWHIGRVATLKEYRNKGIGKFMMEEALRKAEELGKSDTVILGAQAQATDFYKKLGFVAYGETFYEQDCPHIMMKAKI